LFRSRAVGYRPAMPDDRLTPADPQDFADSIAFALEFKGSKRFHEGDKLMAELTANHIVRIWSAPAMSS
jgi:hypothetical protein